jgi:hypothetical protein
MPLEQSEWDPNPPENDNSKTCSAQVATQSSVSPHKTTPEVSAGFTRACRSPAKWHLRSGFNRTVFSDGVFPQGGCVPCASSLLFVLL